MKKYTLVIFCVLGCVYYNTLYNAKECYERAIKSTPPNKDLLEKSIVKCAKIVEYYPNSKYVPDALFLMGKSFLAREEHGDAIRTFEKLITHYPRHKLAETSRLELGRTYLKRGDHIEARTILNKVNENREEATKLIMESYLIDNEYKNAIEVGNKFIAHFPKSNSRLEVLTMMGNSYDSLGVYDSAVTYYEEALKVSSRRFHLVLSIGNILIVLGRYEEALQKLTTLKGLVKSIEEEKLELVIASCYRAKGAPSEALKILEPLEKSADAKYMMGLIYEEDFSDLDKAREYYEEARKLGGTSRTGTQALIRASRIGKLTEYREKIQDSTQVEDLAKTQFLLAELYWVEFNRVDEAIQEYEKVIQNFPQSEDASKAAYAIAWLIETVKKDTTKAISAYERVERDFPDTQYGERSRESLSRLRTTAGDENPEE